ncbi:glutamine-hydrolyzing GMP synthase, partial [candidate division KSB1 bacterium]|nr:glutamine-hydrolyzing GMP synthase [candidate division KSB1 bacterium]NIR70687.1 glutamine-hydrolyzing GMP synthase [candidate division KSB1 bacterium]NIS26039.1 glutamine-hydrolyzing GMP synthase [candidate division KSB1 bacterium]NIT72863.1 glutamine-hydrolyzing GMP synthase [candidate division KSB1 bacterium]NIU26704.1 glutamine-hydrolyzing GMP synthase [candidate division KSB1 bacterium]
MKSHPKELILILDFGSQYTQLITRRVREVGVYSEIRPFNTPIEDIRRLNPKGIILSGGPASVYDESAPLPDLHLFELNMPILGVCYGMQVVAYHFGGKVSGAAKREYGLARLHIEKQNGLFKNVNQDSQVWMSHGDALVELPDGFE